MSALFTNTSEFITEAYNVRVDNYKPFEDLTAIKEMIEEIRTNPERIIAALEELKKAAEDNCYDQYVCPKCGGNMEFKYDECGEIYHECDECGRHFE